VDKGERPRVAAGSQPIDVAVPLVKRALKVLADREVTPQLGLLKSTLLQLDSSFSERDYGSSSFRDFADKLAGHGLVTLKHQGRSTLVELLEGADAADVSPLATGEATAEIGMPGPEPTETGEAAAVVDGEVISVPVDPGMAPGTGYAQRRDDHGHGRREPVDAASLGEGVALVRHVLAEAVTPVRWPMYPRQFKQFLRAAVPSFDERRYGSIAELMRACQKDGLLKLERDRQGGLRVFAGSGSAPRGPVPHGWSLLTGGQSAVATGVEETGEGPELHDGVPPPPAVPSAEFPDDDIGNRIQGGAVDVTRLKLGQVGTRPSPGPDVEDPEQQPESNESAILESIAPARKPRSRAPRKAAGTRKAAAKRTTSRRKRE
jgi:hypothetical protein